MRCLYTIFASLFCAISYSHLLYHHPVQVQSSLHPITVLKPDSLPNYAYSNGEQTNNATHNAAKPSSNEANKDQLVQYEAFLKRHTLMNELTLILNKLVYSYLPTERTVHLNQMQRIVEQLQQLDSSKILNSKADEKIVIVIVPREAFEDWANIKKKPSYVPNVKIVNPFNYTHPLDLNTLSMALNQNNIHSYQPQPAVFLNPNIQPPFYIPINHQPSLAASKIGQQNLIAGLVKNSQSVYPMGYTQYLPQYAVSPVKQSSNHFNPLQSNLIVQSFPPIYNVPTLQGYSLVQPNPVFSKSLFGMKK